MERIVTFIFGLFLIVILFMATVPAPASIKPIHRSSLQIEIESDKLGQALRLLDQYPEYKKYVEKHIDVIRSGKLTRIMGSKEAIAIEMTDHYIDRHSVEWLASTFVHEARHHQQWYDGVVMTDQQRELDANFVQATALFWMGGDEYVVEDLLAQDGLHFDTNGNGVLDEGDNWGY